MWAGSVSYVCFPPETKPAEDRVTVQCVGMCVELKTEAEHAPTVMACRSSGLTEAINISDALF